MVLPVRVLTKLLFVSLEFEDFEISLLGGGGGSWGPYICTIREEALAEIRKMKKYQVRDTSNLLIAASTSLSWCRGFEVRN
jgi:hypothetical protein